MYECHKGLLSTTMWTTQKRAIHELVIVLQEGHYETAPQVADGWTLASKNAMDRVLVFWSGVGEGVQRFNPSCDVWQTTAPRGRLKKSPLRKVLLTAQSFSMVLLDLIGPVEPRSSKVKQYVLTLDDSVTRYSESGAGTYKRS